MPSYVHGGGRRTLDDATIVRMYVHDEIDSDTIGAAARCSPSTVLRIVRAAGHPVRATGGHRRPSLAIPESEVIARYLAGQSGPQIAAAAGCTPSSVYHRLRRAGVQIRDSATAGQLAERMRTKRAPAGGGDG